jgi:periplasmic protein TonB
LRQISPELLTQTAAIVFTAAILWTLYTEHDRADLRPPANDPGIRISLLQEEPAPEPPKAEPERPKPRETTVKRAAAAPAPMPDLPAPAVTDPPATDAALAMAAEPPAPATPVSHASIEAAYAAALRQNIDARTAVPDSVAYRLLRPSGSARIRFVLDRIGSPGEVGIARTSGSGILDAQAVRIVSSGHYPPFPDDAYPGESRHVFIVTIEFRS